MKTLDERRKETMLQYPIFLLQLHDGENEDLGVTYWRTDRVFLDNEEAHMFASSRPHYYGEENEDWRIYAVPAAGELCNRLEKT